MPKENVECVSIDADLLTELVAGEFVFGEYLRAVRGAKEVTIRQLAKAVGKTPTYLNDIERGNALAISCKSFSVKLSRFSFAPIF